MMMSLSRAGGGSGGGLQPMAPASAAASSTACREAVYGEPVCVIRWLAAADAGNRMINSSSSAGGFRTADTLEPWNMFCVGSGQSLSIQRERPMIIIDDDGDAGGDPEPGRMVLEQAHKWTLSSSVRAAAVLPLQSTTPGRGSDGEEYHIACACSRGREPVH